MKKAINKAIEDLEYIKDCDWMKYASTLMFTHGNFKHEGVTINDVITDLRVLLTTKGEEEDD